MQKQKLLSLSFYSRHVKHWFDSIQTEPTVTPHQNFNNKRTMTSVNSITRQIANLEIASKKTSSTNTSTSITHPKLYKQPSSQNVSKLLTKYAAPNPFKNASNKPVHSSSLRYPTTTATGSSATNAAAAATATKHGPGQQQQPPIDIGRYDGGLELDNEKRGEIVYGQAAEDLALDSSVSKLETFLFSPCYIALNKKKLHTTFSGHTQPVNGPSTPSK